jgi:hypothetical protein
MRDVITHASPENPGQERILVARRFTKRRVIAPALFAMASFLFVLLAYLPYSRWLVQAEIRPGIYLKRVSEAPLLNFTKSGDADQIPSATYSKEFPTQLAFTLTHTKTEPGNSHSLGREQAVQLWKLRNRFAQEPSLYAAVLRCLSEAEVSLERNQDQQRLLPREVRLRDAQNSEMRRQREVSCSPEMITLFWGAVSEGERLDPDNGFFPMMRAAILFVMHRETEAFTALDKAASARTWNDYSTDEAMGRMKLREMIQGPMGVLAESPYVRYVTYPHLRLLRATARTAVGVTLRGSSSEKRDENAWRVRCNLARLGALMRSESTSNVGTMAGTTITNTAMTRPGGAEIPEAIFKSPVAERVQWKSEQFQEYARKRGYRNDAAFFDSEREKPLEIDAIYETAEERGLDSTDRIYRTIMIWAGSSVLIHLVAIVLVLGGIAFGLAKTPRLRAGQALHPAIRWGLAVLVTPLPLTLAAILYGDRETILWCFNSCFAASLLLGTLSILRGTEKIRNLLIFVATFPATLLLLAIGCSAAIPAVNMLEVLGKVIGLYASEPYGVSKSIPGSVVIVLSSALLPLLWISGLAIVSWYKKVPISVGIVRGAFRSALSVASLLLLLHCGVVLWTLHEETEGRRELVDMIRHEGRYYARLAGKPWPALNRLP